MSKFFIKLSKIQFPFVRQAIIRTVGKRRYSLIGVCWGLIRHNSSKKKRHQQQIVWSSVIIEVRFFSNKKNSLLYERFLTNTWNAIKIVISRFKFFTPGFNFLILASYYYIFFGIHYKQEIVFLTSLIWNLKVLLKTLVKF